MSFTDLMTLRRSRYALTDKIPFSDEHLQELLEKCVKNTPSAFNSQSARLVLLLGEKHKQFWDMTLQCLQKIISEQQLPATKQKIASFAAAYGTILYYDDTDTVKGLQAKFPTYAANFPVWAQQANAMLQYAVWTALAEEGVGASLQHYNPLIDEAAAQAYHIAPSWQLVAQMPFGIAGGPAGEKTFLPLEQRFKIEK